MGQEALEAARWQANGEACEGDSEVSALPRHMYRDPLKIMMDREKRSCKGCKHLVTGWGKQSCEQGRKPHPETKQLTKCVKFKEGN